MIARLSQGLFDKTKYVFIMGHMRSRSSLLYHLLNNNPECAGIGESNRFYHSELDFTKQVLATISNNNSFQIRSKYVVDQINHNEKTPDLNLLNKFDLKFIFLFRDPKESVFSLMELTKKYYEPMSEAKALRYYIDRLNFLIKVLEKTDPQICLMLNSFDLISHPEQVLLALSEFLNLSESLTSKYKTDKNTGISGDPSQAIYKGEIILKKKPIVNNLGEDYTKAYELFNDLKDR